MNTLILGVGNTLLSDEGVGIHVIEAMQNGYPGNGSVTYLDGGTLSFTLATAIEACDSLIVVDAGALGLSAGSVETMEGVSMDAFLGRAKLSVHEVGLLDLLDIARLTHTLPERRALTVIQPEKIDWGELPTADVAAAIPVAIEQILEKLDGWYGGRDAWRESVPSAVNI